MNKFYSKIVCKALKIMEMEKSNSIGSWAGRYGEQRKNYVKISKKRTAKFFQWKIFKKGYLSLVWGEQDFKNRK